MDGFEVIGDLRRELVAFAQDQGAAREVREAVALCASEALTNVLVHAYLDQQPAEVLIDAHVDTENRLVICVQDEGRPRDAAEPAPELRMGESLMAAVADHLQITDSPEHGRRVSLSLSLHGAHTG